MTNIQKSKKTRIKKKKKNSRRQGNISPPCGMRDWGLPTPQGADHCEASTVEGLPGPFRGRPRHGQLPVTLGVKSSELLIFPKVFSKQQQPQQFSFQSGTFHGLFGHEITSIRAAVLLCVESGMELVV